MEDNLGVRLETGKKMNIILNKFIAQNQKSPNANGFNLLELIVVLAIMGIFTALAIPAFGEFITNNRLVNILNGVAGGIHYARSEAIVRGVNISICAGNNSTSNPGCSNNNNWGNGYTIYSDLNQNGLLDSNDEVLRFQSAYSGSIEIANTSTSLITYNNEGFLISGSGNIDFCTNHNDRRLTIAANGSIRLLSTSPPCS